MHFKSKILNWTNFVVEIAFEVARVNTELRFSTTPSREKVFYLNSLWPSEVVPISIPISYRRHSFVQYHPITFPWRRPRQRRHLRCRQVLLTTTLPRTWKTSTNASPIRIWTSASGTSCDKEGENLDVMPLPRQHRQRQQQQQQQHHFN